MALDTIAEEHPRPWIDHYPEGISWDVKLNLTPVHEQVLADGPVGRLDGDLMHASAESIERYIAKQNRYTTLQADALHARGKRSSGFAMAASPFARFFRFYVLMLGFLDAAPGFAHIAIGAFASFLKHAKLRALERPTRQP